MINLDYYKLSFVPKFSFIIEELLDFYDYALFLTLISDNNGNLYLSYWADNVDKDIEIRHVLPISNERLELVRRNKITLKEAYDYPENNEVYIFHQYLADDKIIEQYLLPAEVYRDINPIPEDYEVPLILEAESPNNSSNFTKNAVLELV